MAFAVKLNPKSTVGLAARHRVTSPMPGGKVDTDRAEWCVPVLMQQRGTRLVKGGYFENKGAIMRQRKTRPIRNRLDLADITQVRLIRKRLRLSEAELTEIVDKIGNSIAAIGKEVALQRARQVP